MKDLFKDRNGWGALAIVTGTVIAVGFTRILNKNLNLTLLLLLVASIAAVAVYEGGGKKPRNQRRPQGGQASTECQAPTIEKRKGESL